MQHAPALSILEAAYNLAEDGPATLRAIAQAATQMTSRGPVAVWTQDVAHAWPNPAMSFFERAEDRWVRATNALACALPVAVRRSLLSVAPHVVDTRSKRIAGQLPEHMRGQTSDTAVVAVMANTGNGDSLSIGFGYQAVSAWPAPRLLQLDTIAQHLAAAWRLRVALTTATPRRPVVAELRVDGTPAYLTLSTSSATARDSLRRGVLAREGVRAGRRSCDEHALWPALVAGRWSLLDAFTAAGTRYIVAHENPPEAAPLRALTQREQLVLDHVLAGRAGKWIALELGISEPTVARTIRTAVRRLGVADPVALAGVQATRFESLDGVIADRALAVGHKTLDRCSMDSLTRSERDVMAGMLNGQRVAAIAWGRGTSRRTVALQMASIYRKMGVSSRRELLAHLCLRELV
jgi:DNA-binding NarL/FixJ family response regulator